MSFQKDDRASTSPFLKKSAGPVEDHKLLPDEYRRVVWTFVGEAARLSNGLRAGETTSAVTPWQASNTDLHAFHPGVAVPVADCG